MADIAKYHSCCKGYRTH